MATAKQPKMARRAQPLALERSYGKQLAALVNKMAKPIARGVASLKDVKHDADGSAEPERNVRTVRRMMAGVRVEVDTIVKKARPGLIAQGVDKSVTAFALTAANKQIKDTGARGVTTLPASEVGEHKGFVNANVKLIGSIKQRLLSQVEAVVGEAWVNGKTTDDLTDIVEERFGVARTRARLIARDQVGKLNANVTKQRHKELGIDEYVWSTSRDERVRETHRVLEGKRFSYDDPPDVGNPGEDYQCRCEAIPYIADLDFSEEDEE